MTNIQITTTDSSIAPYRALNVASIKLDRLTIRIAENNDGTYAYGIYSHDVDAIVHGGKLAAATFAQAIGETLIAVADLTSDPHGPFWQDICERQTAPKNQQQFDFNAAFNAAMSKDA